MKIIVTGGSGFIGTNLIESLLKDDIKILNLDINAPIQLELKKYWKKVDVNDSEILTSTITEFNPDYIIHLAARTDLDGKSLNEYKTNIVGVQNIINSIRLLPNIKKIIITSSMLVCRPGYIPINQNDYQPSTIYGESKVETERIVWNNLPTCDWLIIRPTSIWGPWFKTPYRNFFDMVLSHKYFHIGNKSCTKTYGFIGNSVYQIKKLLFADTNKTNQKVYYIGDYEPTNIETWANEIAKEASLKIIKIPFIFIVIAAKIGDLLGFLGVKFPLTSFRVKNMTTNNIIDTSNTRQLAPYIPFNRIEGIKETLKWINRDR